ncbi:alkaline phosphatase D family protein [Stratiformator vulcanicus]|uniref:Alkaline phosphatase D n=1 Tax=Stratiformator vulcanicus TaxID=2527980 RepID=A0A517R5F3_9PLAN|nr:alkaline phosphatase D family protein [Stratiformator vulcanicus]QDT39079.1 Alkaline phosphatase D precursor [Stratiformator vulcanicus]
MLNRWLFMLMLAVALAPGAVFCDDKSSVWAPDDWATLDESNVVTRIAFGSCAKQFRPQPIWKAILESDPDLFILLGDNIYGDTEDMDVMRDKYRQFAAVPGFTKLRQKVPVLATWDDHDYGANDAGAEYPKKAESQQVFLDFFGEPEGSERRKTPGIYDAKIIGPPGKRVQIILLDTRYFRGPLKMRENFGNRAGGTFGPYAFGCGDGTLLGEEQWQWLEEQLQSPAELRVICSSIQFLSSQHGFEKWNNFPEEVDRFNKLLAKDGVGPVIFLSGDRHHAEISSHVLRVGKPAAFREIIDLTSSSLNSPTTWLNEINEHRFGSVYRGENFGFVEIRWGSQFPLTLDYPHAAIVCQIRSLKGEPVIQLPPIALSNLVPSRLFAPAENDAGEHDQ